MTRITLIAIACLLCSCNPKTTQTTLERQTPNLERQTLNLELQTIAFGSCDRQDEPQFFWAEIVTAKPDLWIWLGDIIYADTTDMQAMQQMYQQQKQNEYYQQLRAASRIVGVWDDHDYGVNDGDKNYPKRVESKNLLLNFLDVPPDVPVRTHEGVYQSYTFGAKGKRVKVILLDARYFRDEL